ncbi:MAG: hypothetical protein LWX83_13860 [Anaerolineae bacterium]|nr:hypothetical protein [Anaerolineae bacterium]
MERTTPESASKQIDLYLQTLYSLLRTTADVQIRAFEEIHTNINSPLHHGARSQSPDLSAFIYATLRLPDCISTVHTVILGHSAKVFSEHGYTDVESWQKVSARARRRRCFFDGKDSLACYIGSRSDIEDLIPVLTAYQIEWNKLNLLLSRITQEIDVSLVDHNPDLFSQLAVELQMSVEDLQRLKVIWQDQFVKNLLIIASTPCDLRVRLLSGSLSEYWRSTLAWWRNIEYACPDLCERPVYFISSNTHSPTNLIAGFALQQQTRLMNFLEQAENKQLLDEWHDIQTRNVPSSLENLLYYVLKKYQQTNEGKDLIEAQKDWESAHGITRIPSEHVFEVDAQVIDLSKVDPAHIDPRLNHGDLSFLKRSNALILNIDYPLGLSAYNILTKLAEYISPILGVYVMGKAASLNGKHGDIMIPNVVHDEYSHNTYLFQNTFNALNVQPYLIYGSVLDNQKAVTVRGTFLQNADFMDVFYKEGYSDIEMEAGAYLSAIFEMYRPKRHPIDEIVNLYGVPFDVGVLHYVSDNPLSKGKNLGAGTLSYFGMDSTYATTIAIFQRIFQVERQRLTK